MSHSQHSQLPSRLPVAARLLHTVQLYWKASPYYTTVQTSIQLHTIQLYKNTRYNSRRYKPAYNTTVLEGTRQHLNTTRRYKTALYKKDAGHLQHSQLMLKLDQTKIFQNMTNLSDITNIVHFRELLTKERVLVCTNQTQSGPCEMVNYPRKVNLNLWGSKSEVGRGWICLKCKSTLCLRYWVDCGSERQ